MATPREEFTKLAGSAPVAPLPEFPKLPEALRRRLTEEEKREVDEWDRQVTEFFKQQRQRSL